MGKVFEPAQPRIGTCQYCHKDSVKLYEFDNGWFCDICVTGKNSDGEDHLGNSQNNEELKRFNRPERQGPCPTCATGEEDIPVMEELMDMDHVAKPDLPRHVAIEQPDGSAFITDNVQAEMTCKCGKSKMWMHAGQISTPCPYCRRTWLAVHQRKTGNFKFIHYNAWWRTLWYKMIGRSPV